MLSLDFVLPPGIEIQWSNLYLFPIQPEDGSRSRLRSGVRFFICDDEKCPKFSDDFEHKVKLTLYIVIDKEQQL